MSDNIDRASREIDRFLESQVNKTRNQVENIQANGLCHYCEESIEYPKLFCDGECATALSEDPKRLRL